MCGGQRSVTDVFFNHSLTLLVSKKSLTVPGAMHLARRGLTGLHVAGILLLLASQCWDYRHIMHASLLMWMPGIQTPVLKLRWSVLYWLCHLPSPSQIIVKVKELAEMDFIICLFHKLIGSGWHSHVMSIALFKKVEIKISRMMVNYLKSQYKRENYRSVKIWLTYSEILFYWKNYFFFITIVLSSICYISEDILGVLYGFLIVITLGYYCCIFDRWENFNLEKCWLLLS